VRALLCSAAAVLYFVGAPANAVVTGSVQLFEGDASSCGVSHGGTSGPVKLSLTFGGGCKDDATATFQAFDRTDVGEVGLEIGEEVGADVVGVDGGDDTTAKGSVEVTTRFKVVDLPDEQAKLDKKRREAFKKKQQQENAKKKQKKRDAQKENAAKEKEEAAQEAGEKKQEAQQRETEAKQKKTAYDEKAAQHGAESEQAKKAKAEMEKAEQDAADAKSKQEQAEKKSAAKTHKDNMAAKAKEQAHKKVEQMESGSDQKDAKQNKKIGDKKKGNPLSQKKFAETAFFNVLVDGVIGFTEAGQTAEGWLNVTLGDGNDYDPVKLFSLGASCEADLDYLCLVAEADADPVEFGPELYEFEFGYRLDQEIDFNFGLELIASDGVSLMFDETASLSFAVAENRDIVEVGGSSLSGASVDVVPIPPAALLLLSGFGVAAVVRRRAAA